MFSLPKKINAIGTFGIIAYVMESLGLQMGHCHLICDTNLISNPHFGWSLVS
jgi:hypothetical protein